MKKHESLGGSITSRIEEYLRHLAERRYSPKSVAIYERALRDFAAYLAGRQIEEPPHVTTEAIEAYRGRLLERGFKPNSVAVYLRSVGLLFRFLAARQLVFANPMDLVAPVREHHPLPAVPTEAQIQALLDGPDVTRPGGIRDRAMLETMYSTGIRMEETHRLRVRDVDPENGTLLVRGKGERERVAPLGQAAREWLGRYLQDVRSSRVAETGAEALWVSLYSGQPVGKEALIIRIKHYARATGVESVITPHGIRRACATHMLQHGASPLQIQMLLGHASMRHLSQYLRLSVTDIRAMHARSRLGQ